MSKPLSFYFPVYKYYEKVVIPTNKKYKIVGDKMICPLHSDHDPSLGVIVKKDGSEICHCFGCNYWGNIIKLHQSVSERLFGKYLTPTDALRDLCSIFNVNYETIEIQDVSLIEDKGKRQEFELVQSMDDFDIGDFRYMLREGKREKKGVAYFNTMLMIMVDQVKE